MTIDCIIPCYNEAPRIPIVLSEMVKITQLHQIICVDDGSTDKTTEVIKKQFPAVIVTNLPHNQGKTAAIKAGLLQTQADYILLFDADLENVQAEEIQKGIIALQKNPTITMIIFTRKDAPFLVKLFRITPLFSGQRLIKRADLLTFLQQRVKGFELEIKMNKYMMQKKKRVYWLPFSGQNNNLKIFKFGFLQGLQKEWKAWTEVFLACSPLEYPKQYFLFCRDTLSLP
jgi:glycosyltransferase involved in cell wall biosynthesis